MARCASRQEFEGPSLVPEVELRKLIEAHAPAVRRYAAHLLHGDRHTADDVTQEAMIRLWRHPEIIDRGASPRAWLCTVARNIVVDRARRRAARPAEVAESDTREPAVEDGAELVLASMRVTQLLGWVSAAHAAALFQVHVRGLSVQQAARELGVPPGTVKSRCHYALRELRAVDLREVLAA